MPEERTSKGRTATGQGKRIYMRKTVLEAAQDRIERLFHEFDNVMVRVSGGKDSTVLLHLALEVAADQDRLPLPIFWLDQEAEWQATVDIVTDWMERDDVTPLWLQAPFKITNSTSKTEQYFTCWDPDREADWMREKHPLAMWENPYGTDRMTDLMKASLRHHFGDEPAIGLTGVRAEESPSRMKGLTHYATYKDITWGGVENKRLKQFAFHPLYDWSFRDVWKAIHDNGWPYNRIYDEQYRYGIPLVNMRVSSLQHETAIRALFILQEFEPDTYERLVERVDGVDMAGKIGRDLYFPKELPPMFRDWREYRDYLAEHLLEQDAQDALRHEFDRHDRACPDWLVESMCKVHVKAILRNDREATILKNWETAPDISTILRDQRARNKEQSK